MKKLMAMVALLVALIALPLGGLALAQTPGVPAPGEDSPAGCTTDPDLFPNSPACVEVLPDVETREQPTTPTPQVAGDVVSRGLPRTGGGFDAATIFGLALTISGMALALAARRRRSAYEAAAVS